MHMNDGKSSRFSMYTLENRYSEYHYMQNQQHILQGNLHAHA